jgi:hypothetical protein
VAAQRRNIRPLARIELQPSKSKPTASSLFSFCRDVHLNGFTIPKNTQIVPLLHAVHMDPNLWDEPEKFKPSRFLNAEGKVTKPEYFLPFGVGKYNFETTESYFLHE